MFHLCILHGDILSVVLSVISHTWSACQTKTISASCQYGKLM